MIKLIKSTFYNEKEIKNKLCQFIQKADMLSMNETCFTFEKKFANWQKRKYCIMFNSGSSANLALIQALMNNGTLRKEDKVAFSGITWATNLMPLFQLQLNPVPVDIEIETLNISLKTIKDTYKKHKVKALFITNLLGMSENLEEIKKFCIEKNIILLEDNCEGLGSEYNKKKFGNFGLASTFSFFAGHHLSTIEGGAVCTDDKNIKNSLLMIRAHGWDRNLSFEDQQTIRKKHKITNFYAKYTFYDLAYNLRPMEIQGFIGLEQIKIIDKIISIREKNFKKLSTIYTNSDFYNTRPKNEKHSNFAFHVVCKNNKKKEHYLNKCNLAGIEVRPIVGGLMTTQPFYKKYSKPSLKMPLPNAKIAHLNGFYVGNNPEMTEAELNTIIKTLKYE
jgi:CDP-6-deoxy-D-xylo-4-hexulose-3-dehydrase